MKSLRRYRRSIGGLLAALLVIWQANQGLQSATLNWTAGSATDLSWGVAANWEGAVPTGTDDVVFPLLIPNPGALPVPSLISLGAGSAANSLWLRNGYTLSGGDLTLTGGGIRIDSGVIATVNANLTGAGGVTKLGEGSLVLGGANDFSGPVFLREGVVGISAANQLGDGSATNTLTFAGGALQANGTFELGVNRGPIIGIGNGTIDVTDANHLTVNGNMSLAAGLTGGVILTKTGTGTLTLSGTNNTAPIAMMVNGGTLSVGTATNLGLGRVTLNGSTLEATGSSTITTGLVLAPAGGTVQVGPGQTLQVGTQAVAGPGPLTKTGTGTLQLNVASTFAGAATISEGTLAGGVSSFLPARTRLSIASSATLNLNGFATTVALLSGSGTVANTGGAQALTLGNILGSVDSTFSGVFNASTPANLTLSKNGGGTLTLTNSGAVGTATGVWTLTAGTIKLDYANADSQTGNIINGSISPTFAGGKLNVTGRSGADVAQTLGNVTLNAGGSVIRMVPNSGASTSLTLGTIPVSGAASTTAGGALLVEAPSGTAVRVTTTDVTNETYGGRIVFFDGSNYHWANNAGGSSPRTLTGYAGYTPLVASGSSATTNYLQTGTLTGGVTAPQTVNSLKIATTAAGQSLDLNGNALTLANGGLLFTGAHPFEILTTGGLGTLKSGTGTNSDVIVQQYGTGVLTLSAPIVANIGTSTLTKAGPGTLVLNAANTYTGGTFVSGGVLSVSNNNQLGVTATSAITINDGATFKTTADINTGTHTYSLTGGNATFDIANATTLTVGGVVSGAGGLTLSNTGTLILAATATYTGPTFVGPGATLKGSGVTAINSTGGGTLTVATGGLVDMAGSTLNVGAIAGTGTITNTGATQTLSFGTTTSTTSTNQDSIFSGTLTGALNVGKNGGGTLTLTTPGTYAGTTGVTNGGIIFGVTNALPTGTLTIGNTAGPSFAFVELNGYNWTSGGITFYGSSGGTTSQAMLNIGTGVLTLGGTVSFSTNTTVANSALPAFINGGTIDLSASRSFAINDSPNAAVDLTVHSAITSAGGAFGITKTGAGTLLLTGANSYTGGTTVNGAGGTLAVGGAGTLGATNGPLTMTAGTLDLNGTSQAVGVLSGAAAGIIRNSAAGTVSNLTIGNGGLAVGVFAGTIVDPAGGGTIALAKNGDSVITLTGANTYSGGTRVNGGTLFYGNTSAQPAAGNTQVTSTGGLGLGVGGVGFYTAADVDALFANTFPGVTMAPGAAVGIDTTAGDFDYTTDQSAARGLVKAGTNVLTLSGANTYTGGTLVAGGTLAIAADSKLGAVSGGLTLTGATLRITGTSNTAWNNSRPLNVVGAAGFEIADATNSYQIGLPTLTLGGNFTKAGPGTLTLSGTVTAAGTATVGAGTLVIAGPYTGPGSSSGNITVGNGTTNSVLNVVSGGSMTGGTIAVGTAAGSFGAVNITGGSLLLASPETTDGISFGAANDGYGAFTISGGTFTQARFMFGGTSATTGTGGMGIGLVSGGVVNTNGYIILGRAGASTGVLTTTGGTINHTGASQNLNVGWAGSGRGELNVAGGLIDNTGKAVVFGGSSWTGTGVGNLNSGILLTNSISETSGSSTLNFNGGTLKAAAASTGFVNANIDSTFVNGAFGTFAGGAVIDSNSFAITIPEALMAPTGDGVRTLSLSANGSGYIGAPYVQISGDGSGATGYAVVDTDSSSATYGQVTSIVITNPGVNYTNATVTLIGGGGSGAAATAGLGANTSGGLTKTGNGTLTLTGVNTFTGATTVNGGALSILPTALPNTSGLEVGATGNASFDLYADGVGAAWAVPVNAGIVLGSATTSGGLGFQLGTASDSITLGGAGGLTINAGGGFINALALGGFGVGNYDLITGAAAVNGAPNLRLGNLPAGYTYGISSTASTVTLNVLGVSPGGDLYWTGAVNGSWGGLNGSSSNWSTSADGSTDPGYSPGPGNTVHFSATNASAAPISTQLDSLVSIQGLKFVNSGTGAVTIAAGTGGSLTVGASGIEVQLGAPAVTTISAPLALGAAQTWSVADSGSLLTASGVISGGVGNSTQAAPGTNVSLTISGAGAAAISNTGNTFTGDILVDGGTLIVSNDRSWGGSTIASSTSHSLILTNGGRLSLLTGTVNPGATTTTNYNLVQIGSTGGTLDVASGAILQLDDPGQIYGTGTVTKTGAGTLVLRSQSAYPGDILVSAGTLQMSGTSGGFGNATGKTTIQSGAALNVNGQATTDVENLTINGAGLAAAPAGVITNTSGTSGAFAGPITLGSHSTVGPFAGGSLTLSGGITGAFDLTIRNGAGGGTILSTNPVNIGGTITNAGTGTGTTTISAVIGNNVTAVIQNSTTSQLNLSGNNTFSSGLFVRAGTVSAGINGVGNGNSNSFGAGTITLGDTTGPNSSAVTLTGFASSPIIANEIVLANIATHTGVITIGTQNGTSAFTYSGGVTGANDAVVAANSGGALVFSTKAFNNAGTITNAGAGSGTTTISASIGSNVTGVTQNSATSQLTLSGINTPGGPLTVNTGTMLLTRPLALYSNNPPNWTAANIIVNPAATLALNVGGFGEFTSANIDSLVALGSASGGFKDGSALALDTTNAAGGIFVHAGNIANPNLGANALGLTKVGAGTLSLTGTHTYTGSTTITAGALAGAIGSGNLVLNGGVYESSGNFTRALGTGDNQVRWAAGANGGFSAKGAPLNVTLTGAPAVVVWDGTPNFAAGAGQLLFGSTTADDVVTFTHNLDLNGAVRTVQVLDNAASANDRAVLSGVISSAGGSLVKSGAGVLELTGVNTYGGGTSLSGGTLVIGNTAAIGTGAFTIASTATMGAGSDLTGLNKLANNVNFNASLTVVGNNSVEFGGLLTGTGGDASRTLTNNIAGLGRLILNDFNLGASANTAARTQTIAGTGTTDLLGVIANGNAFTNGLTITGTGTTTVANANTYTGTTTVSAGTGIVVITNNQAFGLGNALTWTSGTLQGDGSGTKTLSQNVTHSTSTVTIGGDDKFVFNGSWTTSGGTRTLAVNSTGGAELNGTITLGESASNRAQGFAGSGNILVAGVLQNNAGATAASVTTNQVQYTGTGTLTLTGNNTYTGQTTINNTLGTVELTGAGRLGSGNLVMNAGLLKLNPALDQTVNALTMGGGAAGSTASIQIAAGQSLLIGAGAAITYSASNNPLTAAISGDGTLNLGAGGITVDVGNSTSVDVDMSWQMNTVTGSGLFTKSGAGTLDIRGVTNYNYAATGYQINAGAILGLDALTNNLILNGGVYEGSGNFARSLGTGANQVQWAAGTLGGGFSARGGDLTVAMGSAPSPLVWGATPFFVPDGAPLIFGSTTADSVVTLTHDIDLNAGTRTVSVVDNTAQTTDRAVLSGVLSNGGVTKSGNGILRLSGTNTFTGGVTVSQGTLEFSTVSINGGAASNLGQGTDGITLSGGALSFVGDTASQSTNRAIIVTTSGNSLAANGTNAATITYAGAITPAVDVGLTLAGTGAGIISGGYVQPAGGSSADLVVASGNWTITGANSMIADDFTINGGTVSLENTVFSLNDDIVLTAGVLNLNSTGVWTANNPAGTSSFLFVRGGGTANLNAHDVNGASNANQVEGIILADGTTAGVGTLNTNTFNISVPRLDVGSIADTFTGAVLGTGIITGTSTSTDHTQGFRFFRGSVAANLAGVSTILKQGLGEVTLSGNNSGLTGTVAVTRLDAGNLILDYSTDNNIKVSAAVALDMRGASLTLTGGVLAATVQNVNGLTLANGGSNHINVVGTGAATTTLNLGAITRANSNGTILFVPGTSGIITTSMTNHVTTGLLGTTGTAFATINDGTGTYFAINDGTGKIAPLTYGGAKNDISTWTAGDHITTSAPLTGTANLTSINSLRYNGATGTTVNIAPLGILTVASGGILQTSNVTGGPTVITGGRLMSGTGELIVTTESADSVLQIASYLSGTTALTKTGAGVLHLNGLSHASGATNVQNGTLRVSGGNAIGDRSVVTLADDHVNVLEFLDDETIGGLAGGSNTTGLATLAEILVDGHTLTVNQTSSQAYSGLVSGTGRLIKTGGSTLTLGGASSFSGDLIVNQGQLTLGTRTIANMASVGSVTVNGATLLLDFTGGSESSNKINSSAPVTLINTGGLDGLRGNNDRNDGSKTETVGVLNLLAGANTVTVSASSSTGTTQRNMTITAASIARSNRSTLLVRGQNLGTTLTGAPLSPIHTGRLTATAAPTLTGGGGAIDTTTISIVPWAIGASSISSTGTSFVTYGANGFRPLDLTTEYEQLTVAGGVTVNNNVRLSTTADLTLDNSAAARTMNSLLVDNTSTTAAITLAGAGASLNVATGAFLITGSATPQGITLSGFTGITTGSLNEYVWHVTNTAAAGVTVSAPFTSSAAALTKSGAGTLILNATGSTYTGPTTINQGVLQIDSLNKLGNLGAGGVMFNAGTLRFGAAFDLSTVPVTLGVPASSTVEVSAGGTLDTNGFNVTFNSAIGNGGNGGLTKIGAGTLTLNAAANYGGATAITGGTVAYGASNALPAGSDLTLGAATLAVGANAATLRGLTVTGAGIITAAGPLTFTGNLTNSGGNNTLSITNSGATTFDGDFLFLSESSSARTLTLAISGAGTATVNSQVTDGPAAASSIIKSGDGTLVFNQSNAYNGSTSLNNGLLRLNAAQNSAGALNFGTSSSITTAGTLEVNQGATFSSLVVQTNSTSNTHQAVIATGKTLAINGNVTIGANAAASTTLFSATGGGAFENTNIGGTFQVGGATGSTNTNAATANFSGLASFTVDLGSTGTFRIGDNSSVATNGSSQVTLATTSLITAGTIMVASQQTNTLQQLHLGSGTNTLNANTLQISGNTRGIGLVDFASSTGSVTLRAANGTGRAALNMGTGNSTSGNSLTAILNLTGHTADLLISSLTMADRSGTSGSGSTTATLSFNEGSLDVSTLAMASRTNASTGAATATVNLGDGAAAGTPTVSIGALTMGTNTGSGSTVTADFNVTGGNVTLGIGSGTAINMANAGSGRTVTSTLDLTGGSVSVTGNILRTGGAGTENATVTLGGSAALNMNGNTIGSTTAIAFVAQSGALSGLGQLNNGGLLTKSTAGTLTMGDGNTYSGGTQITGGTLLAMNTTGSATGSGGVTVDATGTLGGTGVVSGNVNLTGTIAPGALDGGGASLAGQLTASSLTVTNGKLLLQLGGATAQDPANVQLFQNDPGSFVVPASWTDYQAGTTAHDQLFLSAAGGPNLDTLTVQVSPTFLNSFSPSYGDVFQVLDWTSLGTANATGSVSFNLPSLPSIGWDTSLMLSHGLVVAVPEPSRMLLLFFGLVGIWFRRRR